MEMKKLSGGSLRAAGYDARNQVLRVELTAGTFEYQGVSPEVWRRGRRRPRPRGATFATTSRRSSPPSASASCDFYDRCSVN